jgi:hypothetical protein
LHRDDGAFADRMHQRVVELVDRAVW